MNGILCFCIVILSTAILVIRDEYFTKQENPRVWQSPDPITDINTPVNPLQVYRDSLGIKPGEPIAFDENLQPVDLTEYQEWLKLKESQKIKPEEIQGKKKANRNSFVGGEK